MAAAAVAAERGCAVTLFDEKPTLQAGSCGAALTAMCRNNQRTASNSQSGTNVSRQAARKSASGWTTDVDSLAARAARGARGRWRDAFRSADFTLFRFAASVACRFTR